MTFGDLKFKATSTKLKGINSLPKLNIKDVKYHFGIAKTIASRISNDVGYPNFLLWSASGDHRNGDANINRNDLNHNVENKGSILQIVTNRVELLLIKYMPSGDQTFKARYIKINRVPPFPRVNLWVKN